MSFDRLVVVKVKLPIADVSVFIVTPKDGSKEHVSPGGTKVKHLSARIHCADTKQLQKLWMGLMLFSIREAFLFLIGYNAHHFGKSFVTCTG